MQCVTTATYETIQRRPVRFAKLCERGLRNLGLDLASSCRQNNAPVGRRKPIGPATPIPGQRLHVSSLYQDRRKKARHEKGLKFRAARAPENLSRGKAFITPA